MNEVITLIPLFILSIIIFLISNSFLNKIKKTARIENKPIINDYSKLTITRAKGAKIFSLILLFMLLLKTIYLLLFN